MPSRYSVEAFYSGSYDFNSGLRGLYGRHVPDFKAVKAVTKLLGQAKSASCFHPNYT